MAIPRPGPRSPNSFERRVDSTMAMLVDIAVIYSMHFSQDATQRYGLVAEIPPAIMGRIQRKLIRRRL